MFNSEDEKQIETVLALLEKLSEVEKEMNEERYY